MTKEEMIDRGMTYLGTYYPWELIDEANGNLLRGIRAMEDFEGLFDAIGDWRDKVYAIKHSYNIPEDIDFNVNADFVCMDKNDCFVSLDREGIGELILREYRGSNLEKFFEKAWTSIIGKKFSEGNVSDYDAECLVIEYVLKGCSDTNAMMALAKKVGMVEELENATYKNLHKVMEEIIDRI